jgi:SAM-dependent methyltransferase
MSDIFSQKDKDKVISRYTERFDQYGHSQQAVGWGVKGKQDLRFKILSDYWSLEGKRILDIGAGFGDLYPYLKSFGIKSYYGLDLVPSLVEKGNEIYGRDPEFTLTEENILESEFQGEFDIAFISGTFNFKLLNGNNYEFIEAVLKKTMEVCKEGVCANFITDRVDYNEELIFNSNPEKIMTICLKLTRNFCFKQDIFPFEFSVFLNKDDSFSENTIFNKYCNGK